MSETALDLINDACAMIGVHQAGEALSSEDSALGLRCLNRMVDSWSAEKLAILGIFRRTCTLTGAASYTIGYAAPIVTGTVDGSGGVNTTGANIIKLSINGETAITITLTAAAGRTLTQIVGEINAVLLVSGGNTALAVASIASGMYVRITAGTSGYGSSIQIITVAANAYTVLGLSVATTTTTSSFAAGRPVKIKSAAVVTAVGLVADVDIVPAEVWDVIPDVTRTGLLAEKAYCDYAYPVSTIYVTPKPSAGTFQLSTYEAITAFANLTDAIDFPPGYARAIVANLAIELSPAFQKPIDQVLVAVAGQSKGMVAKLADEIIGPSGPQAAPVAAPGGQSQ